MSDSPVSALWVEKYRPKSIEEMALNPQDRTLLTSFQTAGEIPHLLFSGPPGTGKTTTARILVRGLDCDLMMLNASKDRGIDAIRDRVGTYAKVMSVAKWKIVFLDEADGLTPDAQNSLRNLMEDFHEQTRFIFTANNAYKIISPIQSRCTTIEFGETPLKERIEILVKILKAEGIEFELGIVLGYAEKYRDLRRMIMAAQKSINSNSGKLAPVTESVILGANLLQFIAKGDWDGIVTAAQSPSFDHRQALTNMFWAVGDVKAIKSPANARASLAKAVHESMWTPDPVVHFLGTAAELIAAQ